MGFDISYHPISKEQMEQWYFSKLNRDINTSLIEAQKIAEDAGMDPFYINKYIDTLKIAFDADQESTFEKTHGLYLAVVQGFFLTYFYTRGTGFSFLVESNPVMKQYITNWMDIKPAFITNFVEGSLSENYSGGVYIASEQVDKLLFDYENNDEIHTILNNFFEQNLPVFLHALRYAKEHELGLLEATEVVEPNPTDLNKTTSYSNLFNCDKEGAYIYQDTALKQIEEIMKSQNTKTASTTKKEKKGFFGKMFKK